MKMPNSLLFVNRNLSILFFSFLFLIVGAYFFNTHICASVPASRLISTISPSTILTNALAVDASGNIYVAGGGYPDYDYTIKVYNSAGEYSTTIGTSGTGNGQFRSIGDIAIDSAGSIYIADAGNNRIQKFNSSYAWQWTIGGTASGSGDGQFYNPLGIYVDNSGHVYVADSMNKRIQILNASNGAFISKFGSSGTGDGQFNNPYDIVVNSSGDIIVDDRNNYRIQVFNSSGTFISKFGSVGTNIGQFVMMNGMAIDSNDNLYVSDGSNYQNDRIQKFSETFGSYSPIGSYSNVHFPYRIALYEHNSDYFLYAATSTSYPVNNNVQKFDFLGTDYQISNLDASLDVVVAANNLNIESSSLGGINSATAALRLKTATGLAISDITVNMTADRSWPDVIGDSSLLTGKSFVHDLIGESGAASTHTLYVPVPVGRTSNSVIICPNATSMNDVSESCSGEVEHGVGSYTESFGNIVISKVNTLGDNLNYWKITGMTGSGGMSRLIEFTGSGVGTVSQPYQIDDCTKLQEMKDIRAAYYVLTAPIDCSGTSTWNSGSGFIPVGTDTDPFTGHLTGTAENVISNLHIKQSGVVYTGLFGYTSGAVISNVHITGLDLVLFNGDYLSVGGLIGYMSGGSIDHTSIAGTITCNSSNDCSGYFFYIGGVIGTTAGTVGITNSSSNVEITLLDDKIGDVGGFLGSIDSGTTTIADCTASGDISLGYSANETGGFIGWMSGDSSITRSSASGSLQMGIGLGGYSFDIGGFAGAIAGDRGDSADAISNISDSYATGNILIGEESERIGGFVGSMRNAIISNSYTNSDITDNTTDGYSDVFGGFVGELGSSWGGYNTEVNTSHATGNVTSGDGSYDMGGFAGEIYGSGGHTIVDQCWSSGDVTGYDFLGGFAGFISNATVTISNTYSRGDVTGSSDDDYSEVGGYTADLGTGATITNSYSTGVPMTINIAEPQYLGGFIGYSDSDAENIQHSYWDTGTSGLSNAIGVGNDPQNGTQAVGYITTHMKSQENFIGWNFSTIWSLSSGVNDGYPALIHTAGTDGGGDDGGGDGGGSNKTISLSSNLEGFLVSDDQVNVSTDGSTGVGDVIIKFASDGRPAAVISADFSDNRNWTSVTAGESVSSGKSFVHSLTGQAGAGSDFTLYVPIPPENISNHVAICPGAANLNQVSGTCADVEIKTTSDLGVSKEIINGINYWKVTGLTGTGGESLLDNFEISDTLTRLQSNTLSNHLIKFGTVNNLIASTDNFIIDFGPSWNFGTLTVDDLDLLDDGNNVAIGSISAPDTWGVNIDAVNSKLTFTPPTEGSGYIVAESLLLLKIGTNAVYNATPGINQITNPVTPESYMVNITINNALGHQDGEFTVPIVDSDQVNITGFVNAFMSFDIDTGIASDVNCAATECKIHGGIGAAAGSNYTVDLGELKSTYVNTSNDDAVMHSDGIQGVINSIYFDLSTNANGGAVVEVTSATNDGLVGPNGSNITPVTDGNTIAENSGKYGFNVSASEKIAGGTIVTNTSCNAAHSTWYCGPTTSSKEVFNTSGDPVDTARVRMDIAAAAAYTNTPGSYTDTLTFVATAAF